MTFLTDDERSSDRLDAHLLHQRVVVVRGDLDHAAAARVCAALLALATEDGTAPVGIYLTAGGGPTSAGSLVVSAMDFLACPVTALALGAVGGGAALVLASGARRLAAPAVSLDVRGGAGTGLATGLATVQPRNERPLVALLEERTGVSLPADTGRLSADEAVDLGLLDAVVSSVGDLSPAALAQ